MTGKTHTAIGVTSALMITRPDNIKDIVMIGILSGIGSIMADIDVRSSKSSKALNLMIKISILTLILIIGIDYIFRVGLITEGSGGEVIKIIIGGLLLIIFGINIIRSSHRGFTHSLLGITLVAVFAGAIMRDIVAIGFISGYGLHIVADLLNKKGVQLLYPYEKKYCLKFCKSDGIISKLLFFIFCSMGMITIFVLGCQIK